MSRTGLYWTDDRDRLHCSHGMILYGTKCLRCERGDIIDPNLTELGKHVSGFDLASGPDHHVEIRISVDDIKTGYDWREEVRRRTDDVINGNRERMEAMAARMSAASQTLRDELLNEARQGRGWGGPFTTNPPYDFGENVYSARDAARKRWEHMRGDPRPRPGHYSCRSRVQPTWGDGTPMTDDEADLMNGRYRGAEIITDASDTRGVNARRVGPGA